MQGAVRPVAVGEAEHTAAGDRCGGQPAGAFQACGAGFGEPGALGAFLRTPAAVAASDPHAIFLEVGAQCVARQICELLDDLGDTRIRHGPPAATEIVQDDSADVAFLALVCLGESLREPADGLTLDGFESYR